jgi:hypothetical protein
MVRSFWEILAEIESHEGYGYIPYTSDSRALSDKNPQTLLDNPYKDPTDIETMLGALLDGIISPHEFADWCDKNGIKFLRVNYNQFLEMDQLHCEGKLDLDDNWCDPGDCGYGPYPGFYTQEELNILALIEGTDYSYIQERCEEAGVPGPYDFGQSSATPNGLANPEDDDIPF